MDELKYWNSFTNTGRVEDYLQYAANRTASTQEGDKKEQNHAEFSNGDRDDSQNTTYR